MIIGGIDAQNSNVETSEQKDSLLLKDDVSVATNDSIDYEKLYREKLNLDELFETVDARRKTLIEDTVRLYEEAKDLRKSIDKENKTLSSVKNSMTNSDVVKLEEEQLSLLDSINNINLNIERQKGHLCKLDTMLMELKAEKDELENIKKEISKNIIDKNKSILECPFSQIKLEELLSIEDSYVNYRKNNEAIEHFATQIEQLTEFKKIHDNAQIVTNSLYNEEEIGRVKERISAIDLTKLTHAQKKEVESEMNKLLNYGKGVKVFQELINKIKAKRSDAGESYSLTSFKEDFELILERNGLKDRVEEYIKKIPYLCGAYNDYVALLNKNPKQSPQIEEIILKLVVQPTNQ